jgi:hypothetical protein
MKLVNLVRKAAPVLAHKTVEFGERKAVDMHEKIIEARSAVVSQALRDLDAAKLALSLIDTEQQGHRRRLSEINLAIPRCELGELRELVQERREVSDLLDALRIQEAFRNQQLEEARTRLANAQRAELAARQAAERRTLK